MSSEPGEFRAHPPNRAWVKAIGKIEEDGISVLLQQVLDFSEGFPYLLLEIDISEMTGASPEARRVSSKLFNQMPPIAFALVGGTFAQRTLAKLVIKAVEVLRGKGRLVSSFFATTEEALEWMEGQGREFEQRGRFK